MRSQCRARSASISISEGSSSGWYFPMFSMKRPSRALRWSVTTTRKNGRFVAPIRRNLILVAIPSAFRLSTTLRKRGHAGDLGHALASHHRPHHLPGALEVLQEPVDLGGRRARPTGDPQAARPPDDSGIATLVPGHGKDDGLGPGHLSLVHLSGEILDGVLASGDAGHHREQVLDRPELL